MLLHSIYIFKKGNGFYYIQYRDVDGKRKQRSTHESTKPEALKALIRFKEEFKANSKPKYFSEFIDELLTYCKANFASGTVEIYRYALNSFLSIIGEGFMNLYTPLHADNYKTKRAQSVATTTVNIELRTLKAAFNIALRWKYIDHNPFEKVSLLRTSKEEPPYFTKQDFENLLNNINENWFKEIILFAVLTGLRRGEITNLRWTDIDFARRTICVRSSATYRTKNGKMRLVPMNEICFTLLKAREQLRCTTW